LAQSRSQAVPESISPWVEAALTMLDEGAQLRRRARELRPPRPYVGRGRRSARARYERLLKGYHVNLDQRRVVDQGSLHGGARWWSLAYTSFMA